MDIGKWAFKAIGNSSAFRQSKLWQEINPLVYSALFPAKQPPETEDQINERLRKEKERISIEAEIDLQSGLLFDQEAYDKEIAAANLAANIGEDVFQDTLKEVNNDELSEPFVPQEFILAQFDNTTIDYQVFFLE